MIIIINLDYRTDNYDYYHDDTSWLCIVIVIIVMIIVSNHDYHNKL